jgi:protein SCO1/2
MKAARGMLLLGALLGLGGCGPEPFMSSNLGHVDYGRDFRLADHGGKPRSLADFRGRVVVLSFGYTHCPDVCPTTLAEASAVLKALGPRADQVQVLFVTLDPERDTPEVLGQYVRYFHPTFLGLRGDEAATAATASEFRVFWQKSPASTAQGYLIDHAAGSFVFDPAGRLRLYHGYASGAAPLAHDIEILLDGG